jgi:putative transposase
MARLPRLCAPAWPHIVVQTAHRGQPAFRDDTDRRHFLDALAAAAAACGLTVHAYGLQDTEFRLLVTPATAESLSLAMQALGRRYGAGFNRRHGHAGSLWEGRFRATVIEPERHLLDAMLFVEGGSAAAGDGTEAVQGAWSSAAHHLGKVRDTMVSSHLQYWALGNTPFEREAAYERLRRVGLTVRRRDEIAAAIRSGWPMGSDRFLESLAGQTDRRLTPLRRGRPPRASKQSDPI